VREELLSEAVRNARGEALAAASAAGSNLGGIQTMDIEAPGFSGSRGYSGVNYRMQAQQTMANFAEAPDIDAGEIEVFAAVHLVWLLEDNVNL